MRKGWPGLATAALVARHGGARAGGRRLADEHQDGAALPDPGAARGGHARRGPLVGADLRGGLSLV